MSSNAFSKFQCFEDENFRGVQSFLRLLYERKAARQTSPRSNRMENQPCDTERNWNSRLSELVGFVKVWLKMPFYPRLCFPFPIPNFLRFPWNFAHFLGWREALGGYKHNTNWLFWLQAGAEERGWKNAKICYRAFNLINQVFCTYWVRTFLK